MNQQALISPASVYREPSAAWGSFIGDALAMPVHWYYDRAALKRDYGIVRDYVAPRNPHADSILWRSEYTPLNERGDILHDQGQYWGQRGIHYHQFLQAGERRVAVHPTYRRCRFGAQNFARWQWRERRTAATGSVGL